jgi:hypothetical protein
VHTPNPSWRTMKVREMVFVIPVGCTCCITSSTNNTTKRHTKRHVWITVLHPFFVCFTVWQQWRVGSY